MCASNTKKLIVLQILQKNNYVFCKIVRISVKKNIYNPFIIKYLLNTIIKNSDFFFVFLIFIQKIKKIRQI